MRTSTTAVRRAIVACAGVLLACVGKAEPAQCEAMVDHIVALTGGAHEGRAAEIAVEVANERREVLLDRCLADGTVAEVECVLAAETLESLQHCGP